MSSVHTKEAIIHHFPLPLEIVDIVKSFVFYDIKTANIIKKTKYNKLILTKVINESNVNNHVIEQQRDFIELDHENMLFEPSGIWTFGYIGHPIETLQIDQVKFCLNCGNYISGIYHMRITCNCENNTIELPEFFH